MKNGFANDMAIQMTMLAMMMTSGTEESAMKKIKGTTIDLNGGAFLKPNILLREAFSVRCRIVGAGNSDMHSGPI